MMATPNPQLPSTFTHTPPMGMSMAEGFKHLDPETTTEPYMTTYRLDITDYPTRIVAFPRNGAETNALVRHLQSANILSYKHRYWYKNSDELSMQDKQVISRARCTCTCSDWPCHGFRMVVWQIIFFTGVCLFALIMFSAATKTPAPAKALVDQHLKQES